MPVDVYFLQQGQQTAADVANRLAAFLAAARSSIEIAIYDWRLDVGLADPIRQALAGNLKAGVAVRVVYDAGKPNVPFQQVGADPAPPGTKNFVASLGHGIASKAITGGDPHLPKLMHHKYIIRDGGSANATLWTGSTNFTADSWNLEENNILQIQSPELCEHYGKDFTELWNRGDIATTGAHDGGQVRVEGSIVDVAFAPGGGRQIDHDIARCISQARRRLRLCSMLVTSGQILGALGDLLHSGKLADYGGIYDRTQMESVFQQWQGTPAAWKIPAFQTISKGLAGKRSTPYTPSSPHDFMHNKVVIADDTVITGSHNLSHSAMDNAENVLMIKDAALAEKYDDYIRALVARYSEK